MAKHVYRVKLSDGSTHTIAADDVNEARNIARREYVYNIRKVEGYNSGTTSSRALQRGGRCGARHPLYPTKVRCEEPKGHSGQHYNSFYARHWD